MSPALPSPMGSFDYRDGECLITEFAYTAEQLEQYAKDYHAAMLGEPVAFRFVINGVHTEYWPVEPPDDAYDEGTLMPLFALRGNE